MLISKSVETRWNGNTKSHYTNIQNSDGENKYLFTKLNDVFVVDVEDLLHSSMCVVQCHCDNCLSEGIYTVLYKPYSQYQKNKRNGIGDNCKECIRNKTKPANRIKNKEKQQDKIERQKEYRLQKENEKNEKVKQDVKWLIENALKLNLSAMFTIDDNQYINKKSKLEFLCIGNKEHGVQMKSYNDIKNGYKCKLCASQMAASANRLDDYETVKIEYDNHGFTLLEDTYINKHKPMKCICKIHSETIQYKSFYMIMDNRKCYLCDRELKKQSHLSKKKSEVVQTDNTGRGAEYNKWRIEVFKRDGFVCQCCHGVRNGSLEAHHILNWSTHVDKRFDVSNGITLCYYCHSMMVPFSFHSTYGTYGNNQRQVDEYIYNYSQNISHIDPFIIKMANETNMDYESISKSIHAMFMIVSKCMREGTSVNLEGFGTFYTIRYNNQNCIKFKEDDSLHEIINKVIYNYNT